ncbi:putative histone-lysine N-methyltransferase 1 [Polistes fuscatus]|uniref:putative histone-lysine N-methyltransferase 1 n=1 Tax=Polistes fuscatus TaxID=30207 RepID=UPI001CA8DDB7|nr:putative histone-lysine N-methyltransferase 1 [Polistes fuscatus]
MARVRQYSRPLDPITAKFDFSQISTFNRENIMIKQEPCDTNNVKMNENCVSTNIQCKYIDLTKDNSSQQEDVVSSTTENLSYNVITSQIRKEPILMGNAIIENVGTLEKSDNINKFKLQKNAAQLQNTTTQCSICLLSFPSQQILNFHNSYYESTNIYCCHSCASKSCYHIKEQNSKKTYYYNMYECDICKDRFKHKERMQAHLLHYHKKEINRMNVVENDKIMINHSTVSQSITPIKDKLIQQKRDNERETEGTVNENVHNSEASMCELLPMIKQEKEWGDDQESELSMDQLVSIVFQTKNKPKENKMHDKQFTQVHVDMNTMEALLKVSNNNFLDKSLPYDDNINNNTNSNTNSNNNSSKNSSNNRIISKSYALRSLNNSKELNNSITPPTVVQKNNQSDDKLSKHLNACKKCIIPLVKCDSIINVTTSTKLNSNFLQFNRLSSQISRPSLNHKSINYKSTLRKRKSTMSSSIEEPPIKMTRSRSMNSPLKLPTSNDIIHHRKKRMFGQKLERSLRKDNIKNSKVTLTVKKLNTDVLRNKKLAINNVQLKEVKISLIKLPEIKKEIIESANIGNEITPTETFLCQICNLPLASEEILKDHVKKCHTAYISTICKAKYTSKRRLLDHYLKEHDTRASKCCVCQQFLNNRFLLRQHMLLHCIKITLSKKDRPVSNKNFKCSLFKNNNFKRTGFKIMLRTPKPSKKCGKINHYGNKYVNKPTKRQKIYNNDKNNVEKKTKYQEIDNGENNEEINNDKNNKEKTTEPEEINNDKNNLEKSIEFQKVDDNDDHGDCLEILEDNFNVNNAENMTKQVSKSKENDDAGVIEKRNESETDTILCIDLTEPSESDNTEVPCSSNMIKEPMMEPLQVVNSTFIICNPNENAQTKLTLDINNSMQPSVNDSNEPIEVIEIIAEKKKYPCSICKQQFQKLESLQQHKRTYDPSPNNYCGHCKLYFSNKYILKTHMNATHNISICNSYKMHCQFCNQGFRTQNNLRIHELHYHTTAVTVNNKKITDFLQISDRENNRSTKTICKVCGLFFDTVESYQLHYMYFYKDHIFSCKLCDKVFRGLYMMYHHNKLFHHSGDTLVSYKYKCIYCHEGFVAEVQLQAHMSHVHPNKQVNESPLNSINYNQTNKSYVCSKCNMEFFSVNELLIHIEHFSNHGSYRCSKCSRKCYNLSILNDHMNLTHFHDGLTKRYMCDICGEVLISKTFLLCHQKHVHGDLQNEQIVSTNKNPTTDLHIDEVTNDNVLQNDNEAVVLMNPPNSSPIVVKKYNFYCSICPVKFDKEIYLKEHLIEYLDYGDYQCNECLRRFANSDFLKKHAENHLKPGMAKTKYYCILCNEVCKSPMVLESHVAHLHGRIIFKDDPPKNV